MRRNRPTRVMRGSSSWREHRAGELLGVGPHGAELEHVELAKRKRPVPLHRAPMQRAGAPLPVEERPGRVEVDGRADDRIQAAAVTASPTRRADDVDRPLGDASRPGSRTAVYIRAQIGSLSELRYHVRVIRLRVPGTLEYRDLAVRVVGGGVQAGRHPDEACGPGAHQLQWDNQVVSAFGEAFNNAAIHSYRGRKPGDVEIEVDVGADRITIRIIDYRQQLRPRARRRARSRRAARVGPGPLHHPVVHGRGDVPGGTPNVLSMTKYLDPARRPPKKPSDSFEDSSGGDSRQ